MQVLRHPVKSHHARVLPLVVDELERKTKVQLYT